MPELPEVQTVVNDLNETLPGGTTIKTARVFWPKTVHKLEPEELAKALKNRQICRIWRRAKFIVLDLDNGLHLIIHLRMTGHLLTAPHNAPINKHEHVVLSLNNGLDLRFHDTRKFGRFYLTNDLNGFFAKTGPEPLEPAFTPQKLQSMLKGKSRKLKPLLLDQGFLAGLGNIYVDEALWQAKLHPETKACDLSQNQICELHKAIVNVLQNGLNNMGTTLGTGAANYYSVSGRRGRNADNLKVFRRQGQPCPRCGAIIIKTTVGQRGTHLCPACQTLPK